MIKYILLVAVTLSGCCQAYTRFDGKEYYKVIECPDGTKTVVCTSKHRLPNAECK